DSYQAVRAQIGFLKQWIDERIADLIEGRAREPEKTFVHRWITNGEESEFFRHRDVVFECFHNFVAFSQWGNTIYNVMLRLARAVGAPDVRAWFERTMASGGDQSDGAAFSRLERFVMELFRTISPNAGSISAIEEPPYRPLQLHGYVVSPHLATSL